jgi:CDGSH-type Zn-finger protein/uncharacterized Fe-S cluster protein YjdI
MIKKHSYENKQIKVSFDGAKCAHAGYCFKELHDVFDGDRDPPIQLNAANVNEIIKVVEKCPSSALVYERLDGEKNEIAPSQTIATLIPNGPLAIRGALTLGEQTYTRLTLCRCGKSQQQPFCDGSHQKHKFDDGKTTALESVTNQSNNVMLTPYPNGPISFKGNITFQSITGEAICGPDEGVICRCGVSKTKPFCDGSHNNENAW